MLIAKIFEKILTSIKVLYYNNNHQQVLVIELVLCLKDRPHRVDQLPLSRHGAEHKDGSQSAQLT